MRSVSFSWMEFAAFVINLATGLAALPCCLYCLLGWLLNWPLDTTFVWLGLGLLLTYVAEYSWHEVTEFLAERSS